MKAGRLDCRADCKKLSKRHTCLHGAFRKAKAQPWRADGHRAEAPCTACMAMACVHGFAGWKPAEGQVQLEERNEKLPVASESLEQWEQQLDELLIQP